MVSSCFPREALALSVAVAPVVVARAVFEALFVVPAVVSVLADGQASVFVPALALIVAVAPVVIAPAVFVAPLFVVLAVVSVLDSPDECIDDPVVSERGGSNEGLVHLFCWNDIIAVSNYPEEVSSVLFGKVFSVVDGKVDHVVPFTIVNHLVAVLVNMAHDCFNDVFVVSTFIGFVDSLFNSADDEVGAIYDDVLEVLEVQNPVIPIQVIV